MEPRVLHGHRQLNGQRCEQRGVRVCQLSALRIGDQQPDQIVANLQRHRDRTRLSRRLQRGAHTLEARFATVERHMHGAARPERPQHRGQQGRRNLQMPGRERSSGRGMNPFVVAEVQPETLERQELGEALGGGVEGVRQ